MEWIARYRSPWLTWLVTALLVQRDRQRWHHEIAQRLPEELRRGPVPELPGWTLRRHGRGLCLKGPDGELLDVDFNDATGEIIDRWFFANRVESVHSSTSWLAERRLWRWRPSLEAIDDGIDELVSLGAVTYVPGHGNQIVLAPDLEARSRSVAEELASGSTWDRWLAALEPGGEVAYAHDHRAWLHQRVRTSPHPGRLLPLAFRDATPAEAIDLCTPVLARGALDAAQAIELLRSRPDVPVLPEIVTLLDRASLFDDHPHLAFQACAYLLERGVERELALERFDAWASLDQANGYGGNPMASEFALFALQHLPDRALRLVRRALRSSTPLNVMEVASLLAAIDQPWCHRELVAPLTEPEHECRAFLAAALRSSSSDLARRRADDLQPSITLEPDAPGYTIQDMLAASADELVDEERTEWPEIAGTLRDLYPADWSGE